MKPTDRDRYTRELLRALDGLAELEEEARAWKAEHKARVEATHKRVNHWRALLDGRKGEQLEALDLVPEHDPVTGIVKEPSKKGRTH